MSKKTPEELQALFDDPEHCFGDGESWDEKACGGDDPCSAFEECKSWAEGFEECKLWFAEAGGNPAPAGVPSSSPVDEPTGEPSAPPTDTGEFNSRETAEPKIVAFFKENHIEHELRSTTNRSKIFIEDKDVLAIQRKGIKLKFPADRVEELGLTESDDWEVKYQSPFIHYSLGERRIYEILAKFLQLTGLDVTKIPDVDTEPSEATESDSGPEHTTTPDEGRKSEEDASGTPEEAVSEDAIESTQAEESVERETVIEESVSDGGPESSEERVITEEEDRPTLGKSPEDTRSDDEYIYSPNGLFRHRIQAGPGNTPTEVKITISIEALDGLTARRELKRFLNAMS